MKIEYISHASLLLSTKDIHFLTDPFYFHDELTGSFYSFFPHRPLSPEYFPKLDYVYCSHIHDDHCHEHTMKLLAGKIKTILLPAGKPDLEQKIRSYGFNDFIFLENEKTLTLPSGIKLTCYHDSNLVDSALIIEAQGWVVLHQNDCKLDLSSFKRMAQRFKIDYAFFPHRGNLDLYPLLLPRPEAIIDQLCKNCEDEDINYFVECIKIIRPKILVPYSFTVFYSNDDQLKLNGYHRNRPPDFKQKIEAEIPGQACLVIQPGDLFENDGRGDLLYKPQNKTNLWGESLEEFLELGHAYCQTLEPKKRHFDYGDVGEVSQELENYLKERLGQALPDYFYNELVVVHLIDARGGRKSFYINARDKTVSTQTKEGIPFLEITLPASIARCFLGKKYDSFMILHSYRMTFECPALMLLGLTPRQECHFYVCAAMALFDYETYQKEFGVKK